MMACLFCYGTVVQQEGTVFEGQTLASKHPRQRASGIEDFTLACYMNLAILAKHMKLENNIG